MGVGMIVAGCRGSREITEPHYDAADSAYQPRTSSGNAFDTYALAALNLEATRSLYLTAGTFMPGQRTKVLALVSPILSQIRAATTRPCDFQFRAREPFAPVPFVTGWRLIGRAFAWQIAEQAQTGNLDLAIDSAIAANRFGFDLTQGDAMSANLGCNIVNDARVALLPALPQMEQRQLYRLAQGLKAAIGRGPNLVNCARYESRQALVAAQYSYDSARRNDLRSFHERLGAAGDNIAQQLASEADNPAELTVFMDKYVAEARQMAAIYVKAAAVPTAQRGELYPKRKREKGRPWRILAQNFIDTPTVIQPLFDRTLARTRMWVIASMLERTRRSGEPFPLDLRKFSEGVRTDPYTGGDFGYQNNGVDYKLYANGENLTDDGGDTDEAGISPDLTLEKLAPYPAFVPLLPKVAPVPDDKPVSKQIQKAKSVNRSMPSG